MAEERQTTVGTVSPTPHYDKIKELLNNSKLPGTDAARVESAVARYERWISEMDAIEDTGEERVRKLVRSLNDYKRFIEVEVIWDSEHDFLYRQRGQLKLDNSIIEEFLPRLADPRVMPELDGKNYVSGPRTSFASAFFAAALSDPDSGVGLEVRTKDQDFVVGRPAFIQASYSREFPRESTVTHEVHLAFLAAECKTNLDKTMFQECVATAHDLKVAVTGARYYLLCEWLDMTPISTKTTDIDEVIILRGKRLASNVRGRYSDSNNRRRERDTYLRFLEDNPIRESSILRFVGHMRELFADGVPDQNDVIQKGYF